jgi:hypothetical protein
MYPKESAIWPVRSFPETANKNQITSTQWAVPTVLLVAILASSAMVNGGTLRARIDGGAWLNPFLEISIAVTMRWG